MPDIDVNFPLKGIDESSAYSKQPSSSTREAVNVTGADPITGRTRGAQRSGLSKYNSAPIQLDVKVADIASVSYDNPALLYEPEPLKLQELEWVKSLPNKGSVYIVRVDELNNVYCAEDGSALVKLNSDGAKLWSVSVPVADKLHQVKAMALDGTQYVFCAVTSGGSQTSAKLFAYEQVDGETPSLLYEEKVGMFVSDIVTDGDVLYAACNDVDKNYSEIRVYGSIRSSGVELLKTWVVPYPVNGLTKSPTDGNIYTTHPQNGARNVNQQGSGSTGASVDWTPKQLANWDKRAWCWLDASDVDGDETYNELYENAEEVLVWYDKTENNRNLYRNVTASTSTTTEYSGRLLKRSVANRDAIAFNGTNESMESGGSASAAADLRNSPLRSQNLSIVPSNTGSRWAMFMVFRAPEESVMRVVWGQDETATHNYNNFKGLFVNRHPAAGDDGTSWSGVMPATAPASVHRVQPGSICYSVKSGGTPLCAHGSVNGRPASASSLSDYFVVTIVQQDRVNQSDECLVRVNGRPVDSWNMVSSGGGVLAGNTASTQPVYLGWSPQAFIANTSGRFKGLMCEIIVLSDWAESSDNPFEASTEGNFLTYKKGSTGKAFPRVGYPDAPAYPNQYSVELNGESYDDEIELLEGYLAHKWGCAHLLPIGRQVSLYVDCGGGAPPPVVTAGSNIKIDNRWANSGSQVVQYNFVGTASTDFDIDVTPALSNYDLVQTIRNKVNSAGVAQLDSGVALPLAFCVERLGASIQYFAVMNLLSKSNLNSEVHQVGNNFTVPAVGWQWIIDERVVPGTNFASSNSVTYTSSSAIYTNQVGANLSNVCDDMLCTAINGATVYVAYTTSVSGLVVSTTTWLDASTGLAATPPDGSRIQIESLTWMDVAKEDNVTGASAVMEGGLYCGAYAKPHNFYLYSPYKQYTLDIGDLGLTFGPSITLKRQTYGGAPRADQKALLTDYEVFTTKKSALCKWDKDVGSLKWAAYSGKHGESFVAFGGFGYGIAASSSGKILTIGAREYGTSITSAPNQPAPPANYSQGGVVSELTTVRITTDNGETYGTSITCTMPQAVAQVSDPDYEYFKPSADEFGNFYVPYFEYNQFFLASAMVYKDTGELLHWVRRRDSQAFLYNGMGYAVAPTQSNPKYEDGYQGKIAEAMFFGARVENLATLDWTGSQPVDGDTVSIKVGLKDAEVLTFRNSAGPYPEVSIVSGNAMLSYANLVQAVTSSSPNATIKYVDESVPPSLDDNAFVLARSPVPEGNANSAVVVTTSITAPFVVGQSQVKTETLSKIRLVSSSPKLESYRRIANVAVSNGSLYRFDDDSTVTPVQGIGFGAITSLYYNSCVLFQKLYLTDGNRILVYDPKADSAQFLQSTTSGEPPRRCKLLASWRGRLVAARSADNPHNWFMSALGDATDWNYFPNTITATQAVAGTISRAGVAPDVITALVPYSDDLLLIGGDHSIYRMTGDPMAGGQMDLVTDVIGMAFGQSWDKDPNGVLYFLSSRGTLYGMQPGKRGMTDISGQKFTSRLSKIDFSQYYTKLVWNDSEQMLHIFLLPYGPGGSLVTHFRFERDTGAFWEDQFAYGTGGSASTNRQPTAVCILDGDKPQDRTLLFGCEDGYVRRWDSSAFDDDGQAIDSRVVMGPFSAGAAEIRLTKFQATLAKEQAGCNVQIYMSDTPDKMGNIVWSGDLRAGLNPRVFTRARGRYLWIRMRSSKAASRWAFESITLTATQAGRTRNRP
jgi:hypothetical protein